MEKQKIKLIIIILSLLLLLSVYLVFVEETITKLNQNQEQPDRTQKVQELAVQDFQEWKSNFNPYQRITIDKCVQTEHTFRKLYCNIEFSRVYKEKIFFP